MLQCIYGIIYLYDIVVRKYVERGIMMEKMLIGFLAMVLLVGCTASIKKDKINAENDESIAIKYSRITVEEAKEIIETEEVIILDVRTSEEYQEEHIEGALLISDYELKNLVESKLPDKDKKILVYCRSGNRSESAAKVLIDMGYTNVHDFGGIVSWTYDKVQGK